MKILCVGNYDEYKHKGRFYYSIVRKLTNGFTRLGHAVYAFSDRDVARASNPLLTRKFGIRAANRMLVETCKEFRPDLLFLLHADIIQNDTILALKAQYPQLRVAYCNIDPLSNSRNVANIARFAAVADTIYVTTAGEGLRQFAHAGNRVYFTPNTVDASIDSYRVFESPAPHYNVFFAASSPPNDERVLLARQLRDRLPSLRYNYPGIDGAALVWGTEYLEQLAQCRMGLNLSRTNSFELYSSSRLAHYTGNGLLTFIHSSVGYQTLYNEDEMIFFDGADSLIEKVRYYAEHDDEARTVAARCYHKTHQNYNERMISQFILDTTFQQPLSQPYHWPTEAAQPL